LFFPTDLLDLLMISQFNSFIGVSLSFIKSHTLTPVSVAAETHYNLGLKQIWLMVHPVSMVLIGSFKS
jgi:hypothetical protein